jgi:predicted alpha/beta hydrolase family esterase
MNGAPPSVLLLPGWLRPLRGDWSARLEEEVIAASGPVLLAAQSLGCVLPAAWAAARVPRTPPGSMVRC